QKNIHWTPLMSAIEELSENGPIEALVLLLRYGAHVNLTLTVPETTPLIVAVRNRQLEAARMLLAAGADPNIVTNEGHTAIILSVEQDDLPMTNLLLISGAEQSLSCSGGPSGMNALGRAAWMLNIPMIRLLLEAGADPTQRDSDDQASTECLPQRDDLNHQL